MSTPASESTFADPASVVIAFMRLSLLIERCNSFDTWSWRPDAAVTESEQSEVAQGASITSSNWTGVSPEEDGVSGSSVTRALHNVFSGHNASSIEASRTSFNLFDSAVSLGTVTPRRDTSPETVAWTRGIYQMQQR